MSINIEPDSDNKSITLDLDNTNNDIIGIELLADPTKSKDPSPKLSNNNASNIYETNLDDFKLFDDTPLQSNNNILNNNQQNNLNDKEIPNINDSLMSNNEKESGFKSINSMNSQDIKNEKIDLLYKFKKFENQGVKTTMNYNMNSHLDDMRNEYIKLKKQREVEASVKFQRKIMMAAITGVEFLNTKFDPFSVQLNGWSESVNENIYDYDEVFEELYEKYGGAGEMAPEIKLLLMLGGSGFMFHLSKTMFNTGLPGMGDIMKDNPDLMKKFAKAAMGNAMGIDPSQNSKNKRPEMNGPPNDIDEIISDMNLQPNNVDLDNISIISDGSIKLDF
tara:strand:- start:4226 stop:5227 length:1002 start_codon:yes stop_codon:yes gene_type:complete